MILVIGRNNEASENEARAVFIVYPRKKDLFMVGHTIV